MNREEPLAKIKERLIKEKAAIEAEIAKLNQLEEPLDNPNLDDIAYDASEDILEESLLKVHQGLLERVDDALGRTEDGTYGRCINCGKEIEVEQLIKEPWVEHCGGCTNKK